MPFSLSLVPPLMGNFTALFLFYSPCPGLLRDRRRGELTTDPNPYPMAFINTLIWCVYGAKVRDMLIFVPNFIGLGAAAFNTTTVLRLCANKRLAARLELVTVLGMLVIAAAMMLSMTPVIFEDEELQRNILGYLAVIITTIMFAVPTIEAVAAMRTCDASRLSMPLGTAQLVNGMLWSAYGFSKGSIIVLGPNAAGTVLAFTTLLVKLLLRHGLSESSQESLKEASIHQSFDELFQKGGEVILRSLSFNTFINVPKQARHSQEDEEAEEPLVVKSCSEGTVLNLSPTSQNRVCLSSSDGRTLYIHEKTSNSVFQPSPYQVVASYGSPDPENAEFLPVRGMYFGCSNHASGTHQVQKFMKEENISFWNPKHRVFLRVNEKGEMDCSPVWASPEAALCGAEAVPSGWGWERFSVMTAPKVKSVEQVQLRSVIGKTTDDCLV